MNLLEMRTAVKARCDVKDDALINEWLNEMYLSMAEVVEIPSDSTIPEGISSNVTLYQLPDNYIELKGVKVDGAWLDKIDEHDAGGSTGKPLFYYKRGNYIGFDPIPDAIYAAEVHVNEYPDEMSGDEATPHERIPKRFHRAIVNGAIARAKEKDSLNEPELRAATYFMNQFLQAKEELRQLINSEDEAPRQVKVVY